MKVRQFKKLCRKSAEIVGLSRCVNDGGVWYSPAYCCSDGDEIEPAWEFLHDIFNTEMNTFVDSRSDYGYSWKDRKDFIPPTPKNVFKWARKNLTDVSCATVRL